MATSESKTPDAPATPRPDDIKPVHIGGESFVDRILPHIKKIAITVGVGAVVIVVATGVRWWQQRGRTKETDQQAEIAVVAARQIRFSGQEAEKGVPSFATTKERSLAVLDAIAKHPSDVTSESYRAAMAFGAEKYDDAIASFRKASSAKGLDGALAREGLALAIEAKATAEKDAAAKQKGLEEALAAARAIQPDANGPRRTYALYHEARLLLLLGKTAEAKELFTKVKTLGEGTELETLVESRLAALDAT